MHKNPLTSTLEIPVNVTLKYETEGVVNDDTSLMLTVMAEHRVNQDQLARAANFDKGHVSRLLSTRTETRIPAVMFRALYDITGDARLLAYFGSPTRAVIAVERAEDMTRRADLALAEFTIAQSQLYAAASQAVHQGRANSHAIRHHAACVIKTALHLSTLISEQDAAAFQPNECCMRSVPGTKTAPVVNTTG